MKYDFAGRLTFAQFGMGIGTGNQNMRVYEETLEYDGFSMLAERETNHWENQAGFNEVHVNGRISQFVGAYDAAGNVLGQLIDGMPEGSGLNTYDAAGRRTRYFEQRMGHYNGYLNMVQEHVTEYDFDGDGRPIVEKDNQRTYHQNSPPSGELEAVPQVYQIWSSVLGTSLVTLGGTAGGGTKIFAGGAVIGYFSSSAGSRWTTADPVTGTTVRWTGSNGAWEKETEQTEPLGQMISNYDPDLEGDPSYETAARNAGFPQWQCSLPDSFWGENPDEAFHSMPFECQFAEMLRRANEGDELWKLLPKRESTATASDMPKDKHAAKIVNGHQMAFNKLALFTLNAVRKGMDDSAGGHAEDDEEKLEDIGTVGRVDIRFGDSTLPVDFKDASVSGVSIDDKVKLTDDEIEGLRNFLQSEVAQSAICANFIEELAMVTLGDRKRPRELLNEAIDRTKNSRGLWWATYPGAGAVAYVSKTSDTAEIWLPNKRVAMYPGSISTLHEILHIALRSNDIELSEAVRKLRITVTQDNGKVLGYPTDPDNRNLAYSAYWGQALKQHCGAGILLPIVPITVF